jgi:hypothetical protein
VAKRVPPDLHEWVSFEDTDEDRTWVFDVTFLTSNWSCLYGNGCPGIDDHPAPELEQGCCSFGAHFSDDDDVATVEAAIPRLLDEDWQFRPGEGEEGPIITNDEGDVVTRVVDGGCIFLNRPGFPGGAGCALHRAALREGESIVDWKPEVCWQVPIRRQDDRDVYGHVTSTIREWKRRDWGEGGTEFHWWCTEAPEAFTGSRQVWESCEDELVALTNRRAYASLRKHLRARADSGWSPIPHPALKTKRRKPT